MPLFFIHLRTPAGLDLGDEALSMPDLETAYLKACEAIPGLSAEFIVDGVNPVDYSFVIADETGRELMNVPFSERFKAARPVPRSQHVQTRRLSREIAAAIDVARETARQSRALIARSRAL